MNEIHPKVSVYRYDRGPRAFYRLRLNRPAFDALGRPDSVVILVAQGRPPRVGIRPAVSGEIGRPVRQSDTTGGVTIARSSRFLNDLEADEGAYRCTFERLDDGSLVLVFVP